MQLIILEIPTHLVLLGGAGACFPFLFVDRRICTLLLLLFPESPPMKVLSLVTVLTPSKIKFPSLRSNFRGDLSLQDNTLRQTRRRVLIRNENEAVDVARASRLRLFVR